MINRQELHDCLDDLINAAEADEAPDESTVETARKLMELTRLGDPLTSDPVEAVAPQEEGGS